MPRLVDAIALLDGEEPAVMPADERCDHAAIRDRERIYWMNKIAKAPTANINADRSSYWETIGNGFHRCHECQEPAIFFKCEVAEFEALTDYCPDCGAIMNEKEKYNGRKEEDDVSGELLRYLAVSGEIPV